LVIPFLETAGCSCGDSRVNKSAPIIRDVVVRAASMQRNVGRLVFVASTAQLVSFIAKQIASA